MSVSVQGWLLCEATEIANETCPPRQPKDGVSQIAFLRRPPALDHETWRSNWQSLHTSVPCAVRAGLGSPARTLREHGAHQRAGLLDRRLKLGSNGRMTTSKQRQGILVHKARTAGLRIPSQLAVFAALLASFGGPASPLLAAPSIELIFNDPQRLERPADHCAAESCKRLLKLIQEAESTIDLSVYGMRNQSDLLKALEDAVARGVKVRAVVDRDRKNKNYYTSTDSWAQRLAAVRSDFEAEGILDKNHPSRFGNRIMHNKFVIIDQRWLWTGSSNISDAGTGGYNANIVAIANSPALAGIYTQEFEQMWSGRYHQLKPPNGAQRLNIAGVEGSVWFSPQDKALSQGVRPLLANAQARIDLAMFYLTDQNIASELIAAHRRGVAVRVIVDATSAGTRYTKHELLRKAGVAVKVENWGSKMHMKAAAIDDRWMVVGSMNWSYSGDRTNDENTLILSSAALASDFTSFFDQLWRSIPAKWGRPGTRPEPESWDSGTACTDGIDNDFDNLVDHKDPQCARSG